MRLHFSRIQHRLELIFWTLAIHLMSQSSLVRNILVRIHQLSQPLLTPHWQRRLVTLAGAAFLSGLLFGLMVVITL